VTAHHISLADLTRAGAPEISHYRDRERAPASPAEWLGIAVGRLPDLSATARTADAVAPRSRVQSVEVRAPLLEALSTELGVAAATVEAARQSLLARHPGCGDSDADEYAALLEAAHRGSPRRADRMIAGYTAFIGGAIEAAGGLADAELDAARAGRWERSDHGRLAELRAAQLHAALTNALGGLLAYARLVAEDVAALRG
jgi:hypothetical protein